MEEQTTIQTSGTPVDPVAGAEEQKPVEAPAVETKQDENATPADPATANVPADPVTPEKDFMNAYNALCKEKGYELAFEIKPVFDGKIYDLTKVTIVYSVAKVK